MKGKERLNRASFSSGLDPIQWKGKEHSLIWFHNKTKPAAKKKYLGINQKKLLSRIAFSF